MSPIVGEVYGNLTVLSLKPFVCLCACGETVRRYGAWVVRNGVKSCGCLHRGPNPRAYWWTRAKIRPLECLTPDEKHDTRIWRIACAVCGAEREATEAVANAARLAREQREFLLQAARERELADLRRRHADAANRTIAAAAAQLSRSSSLPRSSLVVHDDVPPTFSRTAPFASLSISSAFVRQGGGLASCTILFTTTRILWVNTCIFSQ